MLTLKQLAHALALSEHGNFRRAAEAQYLSQPAFSRSIRNLEESLGVSLFDRQTHEVTPTLYGDVLLRRARHIQDEVEELHREVQLLQGLEAGRFAVAMGVYPAELSCSRAMGELIRDHPELRCEHIIANWRKVMSLVRTRRVDVGVGEISVAKSDDLLRTELVGQHDLVLFCRPEHPLLRLEHVSESDIDAYPMAMVHLPPRVGKVFPGKCDTDPATGDLIPSVEVEDLAAVRTIVSASNAFGMATPIQLEPWLRRRQFGVLAYQPRWMKLQYGFMYLRDRMLSPAAVAFMQLVRNFELDLAQRNRQLMKQLFSGFDNAESVK